MSKIKKFSIAALIDRELLFLCDVSGVRGPKQVHRTLPISEQHRLDT